VLSKTFEAQKLLRKCFLFGYHGGKDLLRYLESPKQAGGKIFSSLRGIKNFLNLRDDMDAIGMPSS
jgi:hypothetical protein